MDSAVTNFSQAERLVTFPKQCVYFLSLTHRENRVAMNNSTLIIGRKISSAMLAYNRRESQTFFYPNGSATYWAGLLKECFYHAAPRNSLTVSVQIAGTSS
jgi:hypothetical protein